MALIPFSRAIGALKDSDTVGGTNYYVGTVVNITDLSDVNVPIFSDRAGTVPLPQNGISNVTDSKGNFECFVAAGSYKVKALGEEEEFDLKSVDDAILSLTLAEAISKADAIDGVTHVRLSDNNNILFLYASGLSANGRTVMEATGSSLFLKQVEFKRTYEDLTWHVDPLLGSDSISNGITAGSGAFKTIQYAFDQLPELVNHQQTIQLADGKYDENYIAGANQPRPAILWGHGKKYGFRSYLSGDDLKGPIVIKGNASNNTLVEIQTVSEWNYGVYNNDGQLALQDLTVNTSGANGGVLIVSHRNTSHIYSKNVIADSVFTARATSCVAAESGATIEWIDGKIRNCAVGALAQTAGDNMTFATRSNPIFEGNSKAILAKNNCYVSLNSLQIVGKVEIIDSSNTIAVDVFNDAYVTCRGANGTTDMCQIGAPITIQDASFDFVFSETLDTVTIENGSVRYNASNYQRNIIAKMSDVHLKTSNSYVSPEAANTDVRPVQLLGSSNMLESGTNNINGSSGLDRATVFPSIITATSNGEVLNPVIDRLDLVVISSSSGGSFTGCEISSNLAYEGQEMAVTFNAANTNSVQLIGSGTHMRFPNPILIGKSAGEYTGAGFILRDGRWEVKSIGQLIV